MTSYLKLKTCFLSSLLMVLVIFLSSDILWSASYEDWNKHHKQLIQDTSLIRYYSFGDLQNGKIKNQGTEKNKDISVLSNSAFGRPRGASTRKWERDTYPELTFGRWPGRQALKLSPLRYSINRSRFYRTTTGRFSLEAWVYIYNTAKYQYGGLLWLGSGYKEGFRLTYTRAKWALNGWVNLVLGIPAGSTTISQNHFSQHIWHYLALTYDEKDFKLYIDGKLCGDKPLPDGLKFPRPRRLFTMDPENELGGLMIGDKHSTLKDDALYFKIDELAIYNRVLSPEEVSENFKIGCPDGTPAERLKRNLKDEATEKAIAEIKLEVPTNSYGYFPRGKIIPLKIQFPVHKWLEPPTKVLLKSVDSKGKIIQEKVIKISSETVSGFKFRMETKFDTCGLCWLKLQVKDAKQQVIKKTTIPIGITPELLEKSNIVKSPLGAQDIANSQPECLAVGIGINRIVCSWGNIEKKKDEFSWYTPDIAIEESAKKGLKTIICFTGVPRWLKRKTGSRNLPDNMARYRNILRLMVNRYKDEVKYWEIWNEPNADLWYGMKGTLDEKARDYVEFLKNASEVIHRENSQAKIIGICARNVSSAWLKAVLDKDGAKYLDIVSFHSHAPVTILYQSAQSPVLAFRKVLDKYKAKIPLWNTEGGYEQLARIEESPVDEKDMLNLYAARKADVNSEPYINLWSSPMLSEKRGSSWLIKDILLQMADGTDKYFLNHGPSLYYPSYNNSDGNPSLKGIACATLASLLVGTEKISRIKNMATGIVGINIKSHNGQSSLFFSYGQNQRELLLNVEEAYKVFHGMDILGNPLSWKSDKNADLKIKLTNEPVYITNLKRTNNYKK